MRKLGQAAQNQRRNVSVCVLVYVEYRNMDTNTVTV